MAQSSCRSLLSVHSTNQRQMCMGKAPIGEDQSSCIYPLATQKIVSRSNGRKSTRVAHNGSRRLTEQRQLIVVWRLTSRCCKARSDVSGPPAIFLSRLALVPSIIAATIRSLLHLAGMSMSTIESPFSGARHVLADPCPILLPVFVAASFSCRTGEAAVYSGCPRTGVDDNIVMERPSISLHGNCYPH